MCAGFFSITVNLLYMFLKRTFYMFSTLEKVKHSDGYIVNIMVIQRPGKKKIECLLGTSLWWRTSSKRCQKTLKKKKILSCTKMGFSIFTCQIKEPFQCNSLQKIFCAALKGMFSNLWQFYITPKWVPPLLRVTEKSRFSHFWFYRFFKTPNHQATGQY